MIQKTENIINLLFNAKTELKIFFVIWICLFFILSPMFLGLQLTPKILVPEAKAQVVIDPSVVATTTTTTVSSIAGTVGTYASSAWSTIKDWARDGLKWVKDNIKDIIKKALLTALQIALHQLLAMITNSIIKWIQGGFNGQPGFITDWQGHLKKAGQSAAGRFLNELAGVNLCGPFKLQLRIALGVPYPTFNTAAACTLDGILANVNSTISDFQNDFTKGGWMAYEESLKPNNSAFGAWLMATDAKNALSFSNIQKAEKESPSGFKPTKKCMSATSSAQASKYEMNKSSCDVLTANMKEEEKTGRGPKYNAAKKAYDEMCVGTGPVTAKGDVSKVDPNSPECESSMTTAPDGTVEFNTNLASNATMKQLQEGMTNLTAGAGSYAPYIMAIANALINQLIKDGTSGLMGMIAQKEKPSPEDLQTPLPGTENITAFEEISKDIAIIEKLLGDLNQIDGNASTVKNSIKTAQTFVDLTTSIKDKQDITMNDHWASGVWDNKTNGSTGIETIDDDAIATTIESQINSSTIENCIDTITIATDTQGNATTITTTNCVATSTTNPPYSTSTLTNYTRAITITTTTYEITNPQIGKISLIGTRTDTTDSRTTMASNTTQQNYDAPPTFSFSLIPPTQNQIEDISGIISSYQDKLNTLQNMLNLVGNTRTALKDFQSSAAIYAKEFENNPESQATIAAGEKTKTARNLAISALQTITGSEKISLDELSYELENMLTGINMESAQDQLTTTTAPDGTQTLESPRIKYQTYLNDVIAIYNSLQSAKNTGYLSPIGYMPPTPAP